MSCFKYTSCFTVSPLAPAWFDRIKSLSPSELFSDRLTALFKCSKNSFGVGELLARANSADANSGSSAMALSKCCRDSCPRSLSESARPCKNSLRASSDLVETGIFPPSDEAEAETLPLVLLHAVEIAAVTTRAAIHAKRGLFGRIAYLLRIVMKSAR